MPPPSGAPSQSFPLLGRIDIRLLLFGSLLPDIIDKPVGYWLFPEALGSGRIFGHTLLFLLVLLVAGVAVYAWSRRRQWRARAVADRFGAGPAGGSMGLLVVAAGVFAHLVQDRMWSCWQTLLWPFMGSFPRPVEPGPPDWLGDLVSKNAVYVPEIIGGLVLIGFAAFVVHRGKTRRVITTGRV